MSRVDDLGAAWERAQGFAASADLELLAAIPDLLAVVRAAQKVLVSTAVIETVVYDELKATLAAFEEGK